MRYLICVHMMMLMVAAAAYRNRYRPGYVPPALGSTPKPKLVKPSLRLQQLRKEANHTAWLRENVPVFSGAPDNQHKSNEEQGPNYPEPVPEPVNTEYSGVNLADDSYKEVGLLPLDSDVTDTTNDRNSTFAEQAPVNGIVDGANHESEVAIKASARDRYIPPRRNTPKPKIIPQSLRDEQQRKRLEFTDYLKNNFPVRNINDVVDQNKTIEEKSVPETVQEPSKPGYSANNGTGDGRKEPMAGPRNPEQSEAPNNENVINSTGTQVNDSIAAMEKLCLDMMPTAAAAGNLISKIASDIDAIVAQLKALTDGIVATNASAAQPPAAQPPAAQPPAVQPPAAQPPAPAPTPAPAQPPAAQPPAAAPTPAPAQPPVAQPPLIQPPVAQPPVIQPPAAQPPVVQPPVVQPPVVQPPAAQPPAAAPSPACVNNELKPILVNQSDSVFLASSYVNVSLVSMNYGPEKSRYPAKNPESFWQPDLGPLVVTTDPMFPQPWIQVTLPRAYVIYSITTASPPVYTIGQTRYFVTKYYLFYATSNTSPLVNYIPADQQLIMVVNSIDSNNVQLNPALVGTKIKLTILRCTLGACRLNWELYGCPVTT